jgi:hypothetical protein
VVRAACVVPGRVCRVFACCVGAPLVTDLASVSIERMGDIVVAAVSGEIDFSVADDLGRQILESSE